MPKKSFFVKIPKSGHISDFFFKTQKKGSILMFTSPSSGLKLQQAIPAYTG